MLHYQVVLQVPFRSCLGLASPSLIAQVLSSPIGLFFQMLSYAETSLKNTKERGICELRDALL